MTKATESLPPAFAAVIVYVAEALIPVGVPEIAPVDVSNERPTGSVGDTDQDVIVPPFAVGVPEIVPVDTSNDKPDGSDGETLHDVTAPPDAVGIALDITEPFCNVNEFGV